MKASAIVALLLLLAGCASSTLIEPDPSRDCQVRAGGSLAEGSASFASFGSVSGDFSGGAATRIGTPENCKGFIAITRSANSFVCNGDLAICKAALTTPQPLMVQPFANDFEPPPVQ